MSDFLDTFVEDAVPSYRNAARQKSNSTTTNPLIYESSPTAKYTICTPHPVSLKQAHAIIAHAKRKGLEHSFRVLSVLDHTPSVSTNIARYYRDNAIDLSRYISPGSRVIAAGRALYAFTGSTDLDVSHFYDYVTNRSCSWFYAPKTASYVFPVDDPSNWIGKDTFASYFAARQFLAARGLDRDAVELDFTEPEVVYVSDPNTFLKRNIRRRCTTAFDLETKGLNPWAKDGRIICLTLSFDGKTGYYLPFEQIDLSLLSRFFRTKTLIGSNLKYDVRWLVTRGVDRDALWIAGDTQHLGHLLNEMRRNGLKPLAWHYTTLGGYDEELDRYLDRYPKARDDYSLIPAEILMRYAALDPVVSYRVYERQLEQLDWIDRAFPMQSEPWLSDSTWSLSRLYFDVIVPALNTFTDIELEGMKVNVERLRYASVELEKLMRAKREEIYAALGVSEDEFNFDSAVQLGRLLEAKGWPVFERAKKGHFKTNDDVLHRWSDLGYEVADLILEYRAMSTLMKTFVGREKEGTGFFQYIQPDGKVHPNFGVGLVCCYCASFAGRGGAAVNRRDRQNKIERCYTLCSLLVQ